MHVLRFVLPGPPLSVVEGAALCDSTLSGVGSSLCQPTWPRLCSHLCHCLSQGRASLCSFLIEGCDMMQLAADLDRRHIAVRWACGCLLQPAAPCAEQ